MNYEAKMKPDEMNAQTEDGVFDFLLSKLSLFNLNMLIGLLNGICALMVHLGLKHMNTQAHTGNAQRPLQMAAEHAEEAAASERMQQPRVFQQSVRGVVVAGSSRLARVTTSSPSSRPILVMQSISGSLLTDDSVGMDIS